MFDVAPIRVGKTFLVGLMGGGWLSGLVGWVRNTENKAQTQAS